MTDPTVRAELVLRMAMQIEAEAADAMKYVSRLRDSCVALRRAAVLAVRLDYHAGTAEEKPADDLPVPVPGSAAPD